MVYRNGNYCAFYVSEPFNPSGLGANATRDFVYYNMLRAWKAADPGFPFNDSHAKTYSVRDGSNWEATLKPRLRERLQSSKNIVLFLSSSTVQSRALKEEIEYGIGNQGLPVIVIYPEIDKKEGIAQNNGLSPRVNLLINRLPIFKALMANVPTLHVPIDKSLIIAALKDSNFSVSTKTKADCYWFTV